MYFLAEITLTKHGKMGQRKNVPLFLGISADKDSLFRSIWAVKLKKKVLIFGFYCGTSV